MAANKTNKKYIAVNGDTLKSLAKSFYRDPIHAETLGKINTIAPQDDVRVSMELLLPPRIVTIGPSEKNGDKTVKNVQYASRQDKTDYLFPLPREFQDKGYHKAPRSFGCDRGGRAHAGCDLYAPLGTQIYAVADGVIKGYHFFYWKTFALEVNHGEFSIVYGEVQPPENPKDFGIFVTPAIMKYIQELKKNEKLGLPNKLNVGSPIKQGDHIAYVGQLYKDNGSVPFEYTMLHFEKYGNKASGPFSLPNKTDINDYLNVDKKPYKRRKDLENPAEFLDNCKLEN